MDSDNNLKEEPTTSSQQPEKAEKVFQTPSKPLLQTKLTGKREYILPKVLGQKLPFTLIFSLIAVFVLPWLFIIPWKCNRVPIGLSFTFTETSLEKQPEWVMDKSLIEQQTGILETIGFLRINDYVVVELPAPNFVRIFSNEKMKCYATIVKLTERKEPFYSFSTHLKKGRYLLTLAQEEKIFPDNFSVNFYPGSGIPELWEKHQTHLEKFKTKIKEDFGENFYFQEFNEVYQSKIRPNRPGF